MKKKPLLYSSLSPKHSVFLHYFDFKIMNQKQKASATPRKSPRLNIQQVHVDIEPPTFNILTQSPAKNSPQQGKKNKTLVKKNDNEKKRGPTVSDRNGQKRKDKSAESYSTDHPDEVDEFDSDSDFVQSNASKKAKRIFRGECSKSAKRKASGTLKEVARIPKQPKAKPVVKTAMSC